MTTWYPPLSKDFTSALQSHSFITVLAASSTLRKSHNFTLQAVIRWQTNILVSFRQEKQLPGLQIFRIVHWKQTSIDWSHCICSLSLYSTHYLPLGQCQCQGYRAVMSPLFKLKHRCWVGSANLTHPSSQTITAGIGSAWQKRGLGLLLC